jgi:hypothetical protein
MWHTERLIGDNWTRVAPWGNKENAIDSASFLADTCKVPTRVVDSLSLIVVWDSVEEGLADQAHGGADQAQGAEGAEELTPEELAEEWAHENANASFPAEVPTQAPEVYRVITNVRAHPIHTSTFSTLADARACLAARRVNCPGAGTYHFIVDADGYVIPSP